MGKETALSRREFLKGMVTATFFSAVAPSESLARFLAERQTLITYETDQVAPWSTLTESEATALMAVPVSPAEVKDATAYAIVFPVTVDETTGRLQGFIPTKPDSPLHTVLYGAGQDYTIAGIDEQGTPVHQTVPGVKNIVDVMKYLQQTSGVGTAMLELNIYKQDGTVLGVPAIAITKDVRLPISINGKLHQTPLGPGTKVAFNPTHRNLRYVDPSTDLHNPNVRTTQSEAVFTMITKQFQKDLQTRGILTQTDNLVLLRQKKETRIAEVVITNTAAVSLLSTDTPIATPEPIKLARLKERSRKERLATYQWQAGDTVQFKKSGNDLKDVAAAWRWSVIRAGEPYIDQAPIIPLVVFNTLTPFGLEQRKPDPYGTPMKGSAMFLSFEVTEDKQKTRVLDAIVALPYIDGTSFVLRCRYPNIDTMLLGFSTTGGGNNQRVKATEVIRGLAEVKPGAQIFFHTASLKKQTEHPISNYTEFTDPAIIAQWLKTGKLVKDTKTSRSPIFAPDGTVIVGVFGLDTVPGLTTTTYSNY